MNRFIYWLKLRFNKKAAQCSHFCVTCKYFDRCENDLSILYVGKNSKNTEIHTENDDIELKKAS